MSTVWSCGGGTQSAAIAALIIQGKIPKPDLSVIADTGREASETWEFFDNLLYPELLKVGVEVARLSHSFDGAGYNTVDIYSGKDNDTIIMPMFTDLNERGKLPKYCSNEWKTRPVDRFIRERGFKSGNILIGYSIDELSRLRRFDSTKKWNHSYPLVDMKLSRNDCIKIVEDMGWGTPPRSACWMCPYRNDREWLYIKDTPDFDKAVALEKELQKKDPNVYFHDTCKPLDEVSFNAEQVDMFGKECASGMCFT